MRFLSRHLMCRRECVDRSRGALFPCLVSQYGTTVQATPAGKEPSKHPARVRHENSHHPANPYHGLIALPKYKVPPLQQTLDKYYKSLKPFLNDGELKHTRKSLDAFSRPGGDGERLQGILEQRAQEQSNWMSDWWLQKTYLEPRSPLPYNSSPGIVFPQQNYTSLEGQLRTAASFVEHMLRFRQLVLSGQLEPDMLGDQPLDMDQYLKMFGSYRVPGPTCDEMVVGEQDGEAPFFIAMHAGCLFQIPTLNQNGQPLNQQELYLYLRSAVQQSTKHPHPSPAILTALDRTSWSHAYKALNKNKHNKWILDLIQRSLFVLCLDSEIPAAAFTKAMKKSSQKARAAAQVLHGYGSLVHTGNRWFDKTLQLVVGADGVCGWNYEHSLIEGPPLFRMMEYILHQHTTAFSASSFSSGRLTRDEVDARPLNFELDSDLVASVESAAPQIDAQIKDLDLDVMEFTAFGKDLIKEHRVSPDGFIQMALQLAFYRLYNALPATYETATLRTFQGGRTETIRSASEESANFVKSVLAGSDDKVVADNLRKAAEAHKRYSVEASTGNGVDRHLMGLRLAAVENGYEVPAFLVDIGFTASTHWRLSTSQGNSQVDAFMCYGPATADGYGCCYNPMDDRIIAGITSLHSYAATNARRFSAAVQDSLQDMNRVLDNSR